jgi:hypothetical protein
MKMITLVLLVGLSIGLLGCVGNSDKPDTKAVGVEISRDECIRMVKASNSAFRPGKQCSLELSEVLSMFFLEKSDAWGYLDWRVGADVNTPINWETSGKSGCDGYEENLLDAPRRCGEILVTMDGFITHTVLEKTIQPGFWDVSLYGSNIGVVKVILTTSTDSGLLDGMLDYLENRNIKLKLLKIVGKHVSIVKKELYQINAPGKETAWLTYDMSCGFSGVDCSHDLTIFFDVDQATKSLVQ